MAFMDSFDPKWYRKEFAPIVRTAIKAKVQMATPGRFIEWIKSGRDRSERFIGVEHFIKEFNWDELVAECVELGNY